jgi:hypothetical protein
MASATTGHTLPAAAFAPPEQVPAADPSKRPAVIRKWEIEVWGGGMLASHPTGGTGSLPGPAPSFTTVVDRPSRQTSSWYFGDGALLLNQVNAALLLPGERITPLDPVLNSSVAQRQNGGAFGLRISRVLHHRLTAELGFGYSAGHLDLNGSGLAAIEATRTSFSSAWNGLISTGPFTRADVSSTTAIRNGQGSQRLVTGALNINLRKAGKVVPYATLGAGVVFNGRDVPSATLVGNYRFLFVDFFQVNETDTVNLRYSIDENALLGVVGGGLKYHLSPRWGFRLDVRAHLGKNSINNLVDTSPVVASGSPDFAVASVTNPSVQFSSMPATFRSSLSAPPVNGFQTFTGTGVQRQVGITAGVLLRF